MAEAAGRTRTDVLVDLLDVAAKDDATDPLVLICQTLVRNVPAFKFVTFVHVGEDVWHIPCAQPGFQVRLAPPDVELTFVRFLEGELAEEEVAFLGGTPAAVHPRGQPDPLDLPLVRGFFRSGRGE